MSSHVDPSGFGDGQGPRFGVSVKVMATVLSGTAGEAPVTTILARVEMAFSVLDALSSVRLRWLILARRTAPASPAVESSTPDAPLSNVRTWSALRPPKTGGVTVRSSLGIAVSAPPFTCTFASVPPLTQFVPGPGFPSGTHPHMIWLYVPAGSFAPSC